MYTKLGEGEKIGLKIEKLGDGSSEIFNEELADFSGSRKISFETLTAGVYKITAVKTNASGDIIEQKSVYKAFAYSKEYNPFLSQNDNEAFLGELAKSGNGSVVNSSDDVLKTLTLKYAVKKDPRAALAIIAVITLLADVALRKFKISVGRKRAATK